MWNPFSQNELLSHSEKRTYQRPVLVAKCDTVEVKHLFAMYIANNGSSVRARRSIQTGIGIATLANVKDWKPEQEECVHLFIKAKDMVSLLPTGFVKRLIH